MNSCGNKYGPAMTRLSLSFVTFPSSTPLFKISIKLMIENPIFLIDKIAGEKGNRSDVSESAAGETYSLLGVAMTSKISVI